MVITIGTVLFMLPFSTTKSEGLNFIDALFMATSSVCVTGLSVVGNVGTDFSVFGKVVMAILIEIGGLSFITLAAFVFVLLGVKIGIGNRYLMKEALNQNSATGIVKLVIRIMKITLSIQVVGAIINLIGFSRYYSFPEAIGISIFHSISAFNNAGLDIFGYDSSMIMFRDDILINVTTMVLIVLGGLGFVVITDLFKVHSWKRFSVHTKIVLVTTLFLIVFGTAFFYLAMPSLTFMQALFQSITARTAGFATVDMASLSNPAYLVMIFLMIIGASPCSTGGGLKTTTFFVISLAIIYFAKGKTPRAFSRSISRQTVFKAAVLVVFSLFYIFIIATSICFFEPSLGIKEIMFETVSAFGTVGLSMGITSSLSVGSKLLLCLTMFVGRLGPLTVINLLNHNTLVEANDEIKYVEGKVIIG